MSGRGLPTRQAPPPARGGAAPSAPTGRGSGAPTRPTAAPTNTTTAVNTRQPQQRSTAATTNTGGGNGGNGDNGGNGGAQRRANKGARKEVAPPPTLPTGFKAYWPIPGLTLAPPGQQGKK